MSVLLRSAFAAAVVLVTGACATGYETAKSGDESSAVEPTTIHVSNHNWSDMNIYMVVNGTRHRLGTVTSMSRQTFPVPRHALATAGTIYLLADPIGSQQTHLSAPLMIHAGQRAEWRLENAIQLSSLWVR